MSSKKLYIQLVITRTLLFIAVGYIVGRWIG
jgi:hypothetical protein